MSTNAIIMMMISLVVIWGGFHPASAERAERAGGIKIQAV